MNKYIIVYTIDPINTMYEPNIDSEPRQADRDVLSYLYRWAIVRVRSKRKKEK